VPTALLLQSETSAKTAKLNQYFKQTFDLRDLMKTWLILALKS